MVKSLLPNLRWLTIPSENLGGDWVSKSLELDAHLESYSLDLAEEAVYLLFSEKPQHILEGKGMCLVARPVIGPKKMVDPPFALADWTANFVWRKTVDGEGLVDILHESEELRQKLKKDSLSLAKGFIICVRRELVPELKVSVEVILHE